MSSNIATVLKSSPKKQKVKKGFDSRKVVPYIFVLPFIISFLVFFLYPIFSTINMSFQEVLGFDDVKYIGLKNYKNLWNDHFLTALKVTARYTFWTILVLIPLPIVLAAILNAKSTIGTNFFRTALFIPALTSVVIAGIFFRYAFSEQSTAIVNEILGYFGVDPVNWIHGRHTSMFLLVIVCTWRWLGVNIIYFLSGLQGISPDMYESADIDGANVIQKFFYITIPSLKPVIIYVITISVYGGFSMFAESYTLYNGPRTPGNIATTLVGYIYQQGFNEFKLGFASAAGIVLLVIIMIVNIIQLKAFGLFRKESD